MRFLPKLLDIKAIGDPVDGNQDLTFLVSGVDALRDSDDTDAIVSEALVQSNHVGERPRQPRTIVQEQDVKIADGARRVGHVTLEPAPVHTHTRDGSILVATTSIGLISELKERGLKGVQVDRLRACPRNGLPCPSIGCGLLRSRSKVGALAEDGARPQKHKPGNRASRSKSRDGRKRSRFDKLSNLLKQANRGTRQSLSLT